MKAFTVGLIFLIGTALLAGVGVLLFPLLIALAFLLRIAVVVVLFIAAVWLLGTFIIYVWENILSENGKNKRP